jgi:hypothetical protein
MNEQLTKLAESVGLYGVDDKNQFDSTDISIILLQKYTDLIIKECINSIENADQSHGATSYDLTMIRATKERCIKNLKRNLGYVVN